MGEGFLGEVVSVADEGDFYGLGQGESAGFLGWFDPGEVGVEGCDEYGELCGGEAGCRLVVQRFFLVWFENIFGDLSSCLLSGGAVVSWWGLGCGPPYE